MYINKVEICGIDTAKLKVLTNKEKLALFKRIKKGDKTAREEFISGNLKLVLSVIKKFSMRKENMDDLFQVGCIGLIKSIDNFDESHNVRFSTYAVPMIIGEIRRYLRDNNSIRVSRSMRDTAYKALRAKEELTVSLSKEPTISEIARAVDCSEESVIIALESIVDPVSLSEPIYSDSGDSIYIMDQIKDDVSSDENWLDEIVLRDSIKKLGNREKLILTKRFLEGKTQMEVANEIGISQAQVSRLEKEAIGGIKNKLG
ncbi:MAG: RNA polymerase sporulation sigma factor SigG [Clostridia bacterium]